MKTSKIKQSLVILAVALTAGITYAQNPGPPPQEGPDTEHRHRFHILPPHDEMQLNLTADQKKKLEELEADVKSKIESILTPDQLEKLKQMRPPHRKDGPEDGRPEGGQGGAKSSGPAKTTGSNSHP